MKRIDALLDERGIEYVTSGPNVKRGHVNVRCPFCGSADPSQHMGIAPDGRWRCWRNREHRGKNPEWLFAKLLRCSVDAARALLYDSGDLATAIDRLKAQSMPANSASVAQDTFSGREAGLVPITTKPLHKRFWAYLEDRGFLRKDIPEIVERYGLLCALSGRFRNRIVFPIREGSKLIGYTGRCIDGGRLRYLSHPGVVVKQNILWYDSLLRGGKRLYVVEGPFDALKLDWVCWRYGLPVRATCLFGLNYVDEQLARLRTVCEGFAEVVVLLDATALAAGMRLVRDMRPTCAALGQLPRNVDDPGDLSYKQARILAGD